jgi:hypothetical protein
MGAGVGGDDGTPNAPARRQSAGYHALFGALGAAGTAHGRTPAHLAHHDAGLLDFVVTKAAEIAGAQGFAGGIRQRHAYFVLFGIVTVVAGILPSHGLFAGDAQWPLRDADDGDGHLGRIKTRNRPEVEAKGGFEQRQIFGFGNQGTAGRIVQRLAVGQRYKRQPLGEVDELAATNLDAHTAQQMDKPD